MRFQVSVKGNGFCRVFRLCASLVVTLTFISTAACIIAPCGINKNVTGFIFSSFSPVFRVSSGGSSAPSLSSAAGVQGDGCLPPLLPQASDLLFLFLPSSVLLLFFRSWGLRGGDWGSPLGG